MSEYGIASCWNYVVAVPGTTVGRMDGAELERITAFDHHFERAQSSSIVEVGWGFAHLQSDFPHSFSHNRVVVTGDVSVAEVLAETERVLGGAGLTHRYVKFDDEVAGEAAIQAFVAAGYEHQPLVTMIHNGESSDTSNDSQSNPVSEVTVDQLRPALIRDWKVELPGTPDEVINQLADRVELYSRGAETAFSPCSTAMTWRLVLTSTSIARTASRSLRTWLLTPTIEDADMLPPSYVRVSEDRRLPDVDCLS